MENDRSSGKRHRPQRSGNSIGRSPRQDRRIGPDRRPSRTDDDPSRPAPPVRPVRPVQPIRPVASSQSRVEPSGKDDDKEKVDDPGVGESRSRFTRKDPPNEQTLAARAVARSSRDYPADRCLKDLFRTYNTLLPKMRGRIRRAVFDYFRWQEWLDMRRPLELRIEQAVELSQWYRSNGTRIKNVVMVEKAVPAWVKEVMDVTPEWCRSLQTEPALWLRTRAGLAESVADILGGADVVEMGA